MWDKKKCCICNIDFALHPKAKTLYTKQLCIKCRNIKWTIPMWNNAIISGKRPVI